MLIESCNAFGIYWFMVCVILSQSQAEYLTKANLSARTF